MKKIITTLGLAAALSLSVGASTAFAAQNGQGWADCNAAYAASLRDGSDTSIASSVGDAVAQGSSNIDNWVQSNIELAACYRSLG